jgi:hypothetical protein
MRKDVALESVASFASGGWRGWGEGERGLTLRADRGPGESLKALKNIEKYLWRLYHLVSIRLFYGRAFSYRQRSLGLRGL